MVKRKTREVNFNQDFSSLFNHPQQANKLRNDLYQTLEKQYKLVEYLRHQIPNAKNSDARNTLHHLTDRLLYNLSRIDNSLDTVTNIEIVRYKKVRKEKEQLRQQKTSKN
jgi:hypothetical protein